jgi:hypothetical protein
VAADAGDYVWNQIGGSLAGDVSNVGATLTVVGLQGRAVSASAPTNGQVLLWNSTASQWQPGSGGGGGGAITSVFGRTGVITAQFNDYSWPLIGGTLLGDVANAEGVFTVIGLQGRQVSANAPSNQQVLQWSTSLQEYVPATITGAGGVSSVAGTSGQFACSPATGNVICGYTAPTAIPGNATVAGSLAIGALGTAGTNHYYDTSGTDTTLGSPSTATGSVLIGGVNAAIGTGSTGHGTCWKSAIRIGYCSTAVDSSGNCTCN